VTQLHASLVELDGFGVLLLGPSGVGKSECALELVHRGHRLVADDVVEIQVNANGEPVGRAHERVGHHIEIRGLGILSVPDLFGHGSVLASCRIDLACRLVRDAPEYDRIGIERPTLELGEGAAVTCVTLPAHPAGTLATLVEVAARDEQLRRGGLNAAERFDAGIRRAMGEER
jgi:HPr kinase/phosphorylase